MIARLKEIGISRVQLALDPLRESPAIWGETQALFKSEGMEIASGMMGCVGEDYTSLDSIRRTGGVAPDGTWDQNQKNAAATALIASKLGIKSITLHAGFIPHDPADPVYSKMLERLR
ncbi:hypothetical protein EG829_33450, partial [bacterium]|nr:hypothetical protein [bacterium]